MIERKEKNTSKIRFHNCPHPNKGDDFKEKRYAIYRLFEDKTLLIDRLVNKKNCIPMMQIEKS